MIVQDFITRIQGYFNGSYTAVQLEEVTAWAQRQRPVILSAVYKYAVQTQDTDYKTPPTVKKLRQLSAEVQDRYPSLRPKCELRQIEEKPSPEQIAEVSGLLKGLVANTRFGRGKK